MAATGIYKAKGGKNYFIAVWGKGYKAYLGNDPITGVVTKQEAHDAIIAHRRSHK
jgi:hypothetical protein